MTPKELDRRLSNYIRVHRRNAGLSQGELGRVLGYRDDETVARHERFHTTPPLEIAISYEIVFRVPIADLFAGLRDAMELKIEGSLVQLEEQLGEQSARNRNALATARKLTWLGERKGLEYHPRP
jgi:DNA-binding XRE family transcriptional regulator